jgi:hypothetical protein
VRELSLVMRMVGMGSGIWVDVDRTIANTHYHTLRNLPAHELVVLLDCPALHSAEVKTSRVVQVKVCWLLREN